MEKLIDKLQRNHKLKLRNMLCYVRNVLLVEMTMKDLESLQHDTEYLKGKLTNDDIYISCLLLRNCTVDEINSYLDDISKKDYICPFETFVERGRK